jgi:hypothetical protein
MALGLNFGTGADNDGETLFSAFTKINTILSTTTKLSNGDLQLNGVTIGKGNNSISSNLIVGENAGNAITTGYQNLFIGGNAGKSTTTGIANLNIGIGAGEFNISGIYNSFIGVNAGRYSSGGYNTFLGQASGENSGSGNSNTFIGHAAGQVSTSGENTFVGRSAGILNTSGHHNTFIGIEAGQNVVANYNATAIGWDSRPNANDSVTLGNGSINLLRCAATVISGLSDARDKTDIVEITEGLEFVDKLKPITFTWNQRDGYKVGVKSAGFIAQDLLELQNESAIGENLDLVSEIDPERLEARYSNLLPVLVKAIQELSLEVKSLKSEIELLKAI